MDLLAFVLALLAEGKTAEEVKAAVDQYLEDNPGALDQAAVEAILDGRLDDIVLAQQNQPIAEDNRIWFPTAEGETVQVPTYEEYSELKSAITNVNSVIFTETDNQIDFTQDFDKWEQGYPSGSQRYAIHLNEKITAQAEDVVYGRIKPITLDKAIYLNIRPYNSNDEALTVEGFNVASTNNGSWPYTLPEGTAYYYISLTTLSVRYQITPTSVKALNLEIYCGPTNVTEDNIYPKYESIDSKLEKTNSGVEKIEETVANNSEYGFVSAIDSGKNVRFFGPHEKSYTVVATSDNWKANSYVIIEPEFNVGDYVAIKCEAYHGYGTNGASIVCKDANDVKTLSVTLLRNQLDENGFITKYFQIPANTTSVTCTLYGVSNTSALPDADKPVVGDVAIIKGAYAIVAKSVPQIDPLFRIDEQPDTLWNEEDDTRKNHEAVYSSGRIGYIFLTDLHVDYEDNPTGTAFQKNQLKLACDIANCSDIDFLVLGGDYIDGTGTRATATKWMRWITAGLKIINKPVIVCRGNHDKNNNANPSQTTNEQISTEAFYAIMQAPFRRPEYIYDDNATVPELYFYYDIPGKKTRIIAYDSIFCDNPDEQIKWICEQALNKPDAGWKFIIVTHVPFNNLYNTGGMSWIAQYGAQMESIITALNNRTTYTGTAGTYAISVDFTAYQSSVICISTGHEHTGLIAWDSNTDCFFTTTGCGSASGGYGTFNDSSVVRDDAQTSGRNNMAFDNPLKYCFDLLSVGAESTTRSRFGNGADKTVNRP